MNASPLGWRPSYATQFQQARRRRVLKGIQTKMVKAAMKRMGW